MKAGSIRVVDPRVKLLLFAVTCLFVMNCTRILPNLLLGCFIAALLIFGGKTGFALKALCFFLFGLFAAQPLGAVVHGAASAICMAICVLFRIMAPVIMAFTLVFQTTTVSQFIAAFQKMKLPVSVIIPFAVMFRFIPTVQEEWIAIRHAMAFRGIDLHVGGIVRHPARSVEYVLVPLLFSAAQIMEELAAASLARGLDSDRQRTCLAEVKMTAADYLLLLIVLGFGAVWVSNYVR